MGVNIDPHGGGSQTRDGAGGGEKGEGGNQDFVPFADPECHEREQQGIGAGRNAERVLHAEERGAILLEGLEARAHDEHVGAEHFAKGDFELGLEGSVLRAKVKQRNGNHGAVNFSHRPPPRATSFSRTARTKHQDGTKYHER